MTHSSTTLQAKTRHTIKQIFQALDYAALGPIYCDEGGDEFWKAHRGPCERMGKNLASHLKTQLSPQGKSLYIGAGVAEIPALLMEVLELSRNVAAHNLRQTEVEVLNLACQDVNLSFLSSDAQKAEDTFDHLWIVSVLNDPEHFPELSALSYGRANPVDFDITQFQQDRESAMTLANNCLKKLLIPGIVTTSVEEIPWISHWCEQQNLPYSVGDKDYPTAIVKDPICFIHIG